MNNIDIKNRKKDILFNLILSLPPSHHFYSLFTSSGSITINLSFGFVIIENSSNSSL
jgi:site-specific DNA-adenine methylase